MSYLLHTDSCASIIRNAQPMKRRFTQALPAIHMSVISVTGLELWLLRPKTPRRYRQAFFAFLQLMTIVDVNEPIAHRAVMLSHSFRSQGRRIGLADLLIAASAVEKQWTLVTHSTL
jgi:predicted nucleic acid-binding protein